MANIVEMVRGTICESTVQLVALLKQDPVPYTNTHRSWQIKFLFIKKFKEPFSNVMGCESQVQTLFFQDGLGNGCARYMGAVGILFICYF